MKINDELKGLLVDVEKLVLDEANARTHGARNLGAIRSSLETFGQQKPIVIRSDGVVIAGNGTLMAAKELGWTKIAAVSFDLDSSADARAFAIADNRTGELAYWDYEVLANELQQLSDLDYDMESLGWTEGEVENITLSDWEPPEKKDEKEKKEADGRKVSLTDEQWEVFNRAVAKVRETYGARYNESDALMVICDSYMEHPQ